ncbi:aldo/keto reductase, partial [Lacticigenium naphthae]|uniref:aldo/keto reductase n=1 Tax=Lacticigenium naphthae TaxID=515351 RepID=UPI0004098C27
MAITRLDTYMLRNGVKIPQIGLGTFHLEDNEGESIIYSALKKGYRLLDTASMYGNEEQVGSAIERAERDGVVKREDVFVVTKIWRTEMGYDKAKDSVKKSLNHLGLDYIDLLLIHWPDESDEVNLDTWKLLEKMYKKGKVKAIGVSNFNKKQIRYLMEEAEVLPMVNQYQSYPSFSQEDLKLFCDQQGLVSMAYSPINRGQLEAFQLLERIGKRHGKTPAQVALRWSLQRGIIPIPKTSKIGRLDENLDLFDFELAYEEMEAIKKLDHE